MITWKELSSKTLVEVANLCDGHTIFRPDAFTSIGVPKELIDSYTKKYESNKESYKETIFDDQGNALEDVEGVYGLNVIEAINRDLGLPGSDKLGRGFRAQQCREQIIAHLGSLENK